MVTTRGRLAVQSEAPQESRRINASERPKEKQGGNARRVNKPKFDDAPSPRPSSSRGRRKTEDKGGLVKTLGGGASSKLSNIMNLPIELYAEVCSYLGPLDLRQLALTNRRMRGFLMNKAAKRIWKMALASVADLPQCPTDLNEPQYVCLMYSLECYTPGCQSRGSQVDWFYRVRFCRGCFDVKMMDESRLSETFHGVRYRSWFPNVTRYLKRSQVLGYIYHYGKSQARSRYYSGGKHFYVDAVNTVVEKYKAIDGRNARERVDEYTKELAEQSKDRAMTGAGMLKWHLKEMDLQDEQLTARKNARFESVKVKLVEAGWDLIDLPSLVTKGWKELVYKDQQLTPKIWQNIKPKLEPFLQEQRDKRLEQERLDRRQKRHSAVSAFYHHTARDTLSLKPGLWDRSYIPEVRSMFALPRVQEMLEVDTETITKEQWLEVQDEVRTFIRRHWLIILRKVLSFVETGNAPPAEISGNPNEDENDQKLKEDIAAIRSKLALVTASFLCTSSATGELHWFPDVTGLPPSYIPLNADRTTLVTRMLGDLGLDRESATAEDVKDLKNLICTRCDPNIAKYSTFSRIAHHYIRAQQWYFYVEQAKEIRKHRHTVINDHDWLSDDSPLIRLDDETERASVESSQATFRAQALSDPPGETRCCRLCPGDMGPLGCSAAVMKIHIRAKHGKEPDLATDTDTSDYMSTCPCPT